MQDQTSQLGSDYCLNNYRKIYTSLYHNIEINVLILKSTVTLRSYIRYKIV